MVNAQADKSYRGTGVFNVSFNSGVVLCPFPIDLILYAKNRELFVQHFTPDRIPYLLPVKGCPKLDPNTFRWHVHPESYKLMVPVF